MRKRTQRRLAIGSCGLGLLLALIFAYGTWEAGQIRVVERDLWLDGLPAGFDGFRIVLIADLHTDRFGRIERRLRALLQSIPADLLVADGDFKAHISTPEPLVHASLDQIFEGLSYPYGMIAAMGNHDTDELFAGLVARGRFTCLLRSSVLIERGGEAIAVAGIMTSRPADGGRGAHELDEAQWVGNVDRRSAPWRLLPDTPARPLTCDRMAGGRLFRILVSHSPDAFLDAAKDGVELVLAADTHGGQVRLPLLGAVHVKSSVSRRFDMGHFVEGGTQMYINPGIGTLYLPVRILCPPEITVLTLHRAGPPGPPPAPAWRPPE